MKFKKILAGLTLGAMALPLTLVGGCGPKDEGKEFNFILANATVPPVMAALDCIDDEDATTYMWYGRKQTFADVDKLGFKVFEESEDEKGQLSSGISASAMNQMANEIIRLYAKDNTRHFDLYVTDYACQAAFKMFIENDIPEENYTVKLVEDGNGSYSNASIRTFKERYGGSTGSQEFETDLNNLKNTAIPQVKDKTYSYSVGSYHYELPFVYATFDNVEYYMQYPEYLKSEDEAMTEKMESINFKKANLTEMYKKLAPKYQQAFKEAVLGKDYADYVEGRLKPDENGKKTLVVCGTSFTGEEFKGSLADVDAGVKAGTSEQAFEKYFNKIKEDYGEEYGRIVIKPHPSWGLADEEHGVLKGTGWTAELDGAYQRRVQYCKDNNITVLSGQVPMEVLIWAYGGENNDQIGIGGYSSTLYMNAPKNMTKFFILSTADATQGVPLDDLLKDGKLADSYKVYYPGEGGAVQVTTKTISPAA